MRGKDTIQGLIRFYEMLFLKYGIHSCEKSVLKMTEEIKILISVLIVSFHCGGEGNEKKIQCIT